MPWWDRTKPKEPTQRGIEVGNYIINKPEFRGLETYFKRGPLKVIRIEDGPKYAGGKFVIVDWAGSEQGFYLNAVKKVQCC